MKHKPSTDSSSAPRLHFRRFEFKYPLPLSIVDSLIPELLRYMDWDDYSAAQEYYHVRSIYYESERFKCFHEKHAGEKNRKKYRLRYYNDILSEHTTVFLELKRKDDLIVLKDRLVTSFGALKDPLVNHDIKAMVAAVGENNLPVAEEFLFDISLYQLEPKLLVQYKRKALFGKFDKNFRVTFDYELETARVDSLNTNALTPEQVNPEMAVLEVKFNGTLPEWFHQIIQSFELVRNSNSKFEQSLNYCYPQLAQYI